MIVFPRVLVRGAGEMATGVAIRLHRCGFSVLMTELSEPFSIRRSVSFSEIVDRGTIEIEGIRARRVHTDEESTRVLQEGEVAVVVVPDGGIPDWHRCEILIDAVMAKRNVGTTIEDAPLVIGLGPGFRVGRDVHVVVETQRGPDLGRVLVQGEAHPRTGKPALMGGVGEERVLRAPVGGHFRGEVKIGDQVEVGQTVGWVGEECVRSRCAGLIRGLARDGLIVPECWKVGDVDPRAVPASCHQVSDKAMAIAGGVLEAILWRTRGKDRVHSLTQGTSTSSRIDSGTRRES